MSASRYDTVRATQPWQERRALLFGVAGAALVAALPAAAAAAVTGSSVGQKVRTSFGELAYRTRGQAQGTTPPLLLLQRYRGTMDDWDPAFLDAIAASRRVIWFDSAGVGASKGEVPTTIQGMADVAIAFLDALGLKQVDVLGWSMGGEVAQWLALKAPTRVRRLVLAGTGPGAVTEAHPDPRIPAIVAKVDYTEEERLFMFFADTPTSTAAGKASLARIAAATTIPMTPQPSVKRQTIASKAYAVGTDAVRPRLGELALPILIANGVEDRMHPAIESFIVAKAVPNAQLILYPDAGHAFLFQYAQAFAGDAARFLDR